MRAVLARIREVAIAGKLLLKSWELADADDCHCHGRATAGTLRAMEYRPFGRTGLQVSPLALGCMMFGGETNQVDTCAIMARALDHGINVLDTANVYQGGRSEEFVGEALRRNGRRAQVILCSKVNGMVQPGDPNMRGSSRRHIIQQCEASLRRLQTDYLDLYQLHRPDPTTPIEESLGAMDDLVRSGKVRYVGTSNFGAWEVVETLWCAEARRLTRIACEQPPYNLLDRRIERELVPACQTFGVALMPWSPLAGGLLTGKYSNVQEIPPGTRFAAMATNPITASRWTEASLARITALKPLAVAKGLTLSRFALAWVLQQPGVSTVLVGPRTRDQFDDYLTALAIRFSDEELKEINAIVPPGSHTSPYYEGGFRPHVR
ncbi:aldo/keto reductase [Oleiharenicola lentus]|uniref:aldo/keto reductase n=1 Tax=Oleiharenicola lentus TaxID=2508720 RepID=UPI001FEA7B66|nr:aldo/keto reductase [Oleiharenicola lentus]